MVITSFKKTIVFCILKLKNYMNNIHPILFAFWIGFEYNKLYNNYLINSKLDGKL